MNLEERRNITENIHLSTWNVLYKNEDKCYLYKIHFNMLSPSYHMFVTDGRHIWQEIVDEEEFMQKCKINNRNIEADASVLLKHVKDTFEESLNQNKITVLINEDYLKVGYQSKVMSTIPFTWSFHMEKSLPDMLFKELVQPLTIMIEELLRRQQHLINIIESKDREIQDYKDHGSTVSRRHLETLPFNDISFENQSNISNEFLTSCQTKDILKVLAKEKSQRLYRATMLNQHTGDFTNTGNEVENKLPTFDTVEEHGDEINQQVKSWNEPERLPVSLLNDEESGTSDQKPTGFTPEKDKEKERREALRRRLEEETEKKNKKKKRKFKI